MMPSSMREQRDYGKHDLYIEDDIVISVPHGELTLAELHIYTDILAEVIARHGHCLMLADNKEVSGIEACARRYSAQWSVGKPVVGIALYNAGLAARTVFTLVLKAMNMIGKQPIPFAFFKTEQEARDWLARLREQHLAKVRRGEMSPDAGGGNQSGPTP